MNKTLKGVMLTLFAGICWGLSGVAGECLMLDGDITAKWLVPVRLLSSGVLLMIYQIFVHRSRIFEIFIQRRNTVDLLVYAICGIMLCQFTYFFTIEYSNAGTATVLQYVAPVIVMAVTCIRERRMLRCIEAVCVAMVLTGIFVLATHGNINSLAMSGKALTAGLISAVTVVIYSLQPARLMKQFSPLYLLAWAFIIGGVVLAVVFRLWEYHPQLTLERVGLVSVTSVVGSIFGYALYLLGLKSIGGARACLIGSVEPVSAAAFSAVFLGTGFTACDIVGFVLIIATVVILSFESD